MLYNSYPLLSGIYVTWSDTQDDLRMMQTEINRLNSRVSKIDGMLEERRRVTNATQEEASD